MIQLNGVRQIHQNERIRRHLDERIALDAFLLDRKVKINDVAQNMGSRYFNNFISELWMMGKFLDCALLSAKGKDIKAIVKDGTEAKLQKDAVYSALTIALGGLPSEITGWVKAVRDYVMDRYDNGMKKCYQTIDTRYKK